MPPILHLPGSAPVRVLSDGPFALPLAKMALRYPTTREVTLLNLGKSVPPRDERVKLLIGANTTDKYDLIGIATAGDPGSRIDGLAPHLLPSGIMVVAVDSFNRGKHVKQTLQKHFKHVVPYREHTPERALFFLASNKPFGKPVRPFPRWLKRLNPRLMSALFTLGKDEAQFLYGPSQGG